MPITFTDYYQQLPKLRNFLRTHCNKIIYFNSYEELPHLNQQSFRAISNDLERHFNYPLDSIIDFQVKIIPINNGEVNISKEYILRGVIKYNEEYMQPCFIFRLTKEEEIGCGHSSKTIISTININEIYRVASKNGYEFPIMSDLVSLPFASDDYSIWEVVHSCDIDMVVNGNDDNIGEYLQRWCSVYIFKLFESFCFLSA